MESPKSTKVRRRWAKPTATPVSLGAEVTSYAGVDPFFP